MPTDFAAPDPLIDALVANLDAVTPRRWAHEAALLAGLIAADSRAVPVLERAAR
jgi:hypothetical protein